MKKLLLCLIPLAFLEFGCPSPTSGSASPSTYSVTYNANGADDGVVPVDSTNYPSGAAVEVMGNPGALTKTGYSLMGWNTSSDGTGSAYVPGDFFTMGSGDITFYAQWTKNTHLLSYTVTYNANGADTGYIPVDPNMYNSGKVVEVLGNTGALTKTGYTFTGWNTNSDGTGSAYVSGDSFTIGNNDVFLYAQWTNSTSITIDPPSDIPEYTVNIIGTTALAFGGAYAFSSTYTGSADNYQWFFDGSAVPGEMASSLSLNPTVSTVTYGQHLISLVVTDTNGLKYSGSLIVNIAN
jgi:uncharacterized repeat protein (TIGR02543 family)